MLQYTRSYLSVNGIYINKILYFLCEKIETQMYVDIYIHFVFVNFFGPKETREVQMILIYLDLFYSQSHALEIMVT